MILHAPFNFVPLDDRVVVPEWIDKINQDIPFEDGLDGFIDFEIEAITPVFVRNGHTQADSDSKNDAFKSFSVAPDGRYFIPASSFKGAVRNAMEILSFGKMNRINNKRYAMRDVNNVPYRNNFGADVVHCGWMTMDGEKVVITDHGIPRRISHATMDLMLNTGLCAWSEKNENFKKDENRTALCKYKLVGNIPLTYKFRDLPLNEKNPVDKRIKVRFDENGYEGTIVFTGACSPRKEKSDKNPKASGKFFEFVFPEKKLEHYELDMYEDEGLYKDFCFIYKDSIDWNHWKNNVLSKGGKVPVFFILDENKKLKHFGLSYLYKLPAEGHIKDYLSKEHISKQTHDMADCIFGFTGNDNDSLRGRVQFGNIFATEAKKYGSEIRPYCGSPRPSYFPIYLKQEGQDGELSTRDYNTFMSLKSQLKGWKRYPVRDDWQTHFTVPDNQLENTNPFIPLAQGSKFSGRVHYHNLKPVELGALIYAIELKQGCFHSIGFAKPFGYGAAKVSIVNMENKNDYVNSFIKYIEQTIPNYLNAPAVKEFFLMSSPQELVSYQSLSYMTLDPTNNKNDFVEAKRRNKKKGEESNPSYLQYYSEMVKKPEPKKVVLEYECEAVVSVWSNAARQIQLVNHKDSQRKTLDYKGKDRLKSGDAIIVKVKEKDGKVKTIEYIRKK